LIRRFGLRLLVVLVLSIFLGRLLDYSARSMKAGGAPAGFWRGILHGALMPCTLPAQLAGQEVDIYASDNAGRRYKLGYVLGVNACGAIFFGLLFRRLHRWRNRTPSP
jgi:hypothetical protein